VWSLTKGGTVLNVHAAYRLASPDLLDAFATLAIEGGVRSDVSRQAAGAVGSWPTLTDAIEEARRKHHERLYRGGATATHCCATREQRAYLRHLYEYFNHSRFEGALPFVPIRLSNRMKSSLGHMLPGDRADGQRHVIEIALNVDLMLPGNGAERIDTLLHEMAHVADFLESGNRGHGASWRAWAARVGCRPTTLYDRPVRFRRRRRDPVLRVPPLPPALDSGPLEMAPVPTGN
jgi:hypothetical protein